MDDTLALLLELYSPLPRHGPGSLATTLRALRLLPPLEAGSRIVDLGCGDGTHSLVLLEHTPAQVVAIDLLAPFIETANARFAERGWSSRARGVVADMGKLPAELGRFDLAWCESAIYNLGFADGLRAIQGMLSPGGHAVVTEICWNQPVAEAPAKCQELWAKEYPGMLTLDACRGHIALAGFELLASFTQPESDWWDDYYTPLEARLPPFLAAHPGEPDAQALVDGAKLELACRREHKESYDYFVFVLRCP